MLAAGTRVVVHLVDGGKLHGRLAYAYYGEGAITLRSGDRHTVIPADKVRYVDEKSRD